MLWGIETETVASEVVEMGIGPAFVRNTLGSGLNFC